MPSRITARRGGCALICGALKELAIHGNGDGEDRQGGSQADETQRDNVICGLIAD